MFVVNHYWFNTMFIHGLKTITAFNRIIKHILNLKKRPTIMSKFNTVYFSYL